MSDEQCSGAQCALAKSLPKSEPWGMMHTPFIDLVVCVCVSMPHVPALTHYQGLMQMMASEVAICISYLGISHDW